MPFQSPSTEQRNGPVGHVEQLLDADQVAHRYQCSPRTLFNQRARGQEPGSLGFKVGHLLRWDIDDLLDFEQRSKARGTAS